MDQSTEELLERLNVGEDEVAFDLKPSFIKLRESGTTEFQFLSSAAAVHPVLRYEDLKEVVLLASQVIQLEFRRGLQHVTLQVTVDDSAKRSKLLSEIETYALGRPWIHEYDPTVCGAARHLMHAWSSRCKVVGCLEKCIALLEFIVDVPLKGTLWWVDVKDLRKQHRWLLCFMGAMFWLAVFSYCMLWLAVHIHEAIPQLSDSFLGITVCAIGTSFPNAVASVMLSQAGKPGAAVASALGSNVQNVFLAMGLPWVIYSAQFGGAAFPVAAEGIEEGVLWMFSTLVLVMVCVLAGLCSLGRVSGFLLLAVYLCYLVITTGEVFSWWPRLIE